MRILPDRDGLSRNPRQKGRINDRPRKDFRNNGLAYYPHYNQRSPKHARASRIPSPLDSQLRKDRETPHGPIAKRAGIRVERTVRGSRPKTNWTSHFGTRHRTSRHRPTIYPLRGCLTVCHWSNTIPSGQGTKGHQRKPTTTALRI